MPPRPRLCPVCKVMYKPGGGTPQVTCSRKCAAQIAGDVRGFERPCADCGTLVLTRAKFIILCSTHKAERRRAHYRRKNVVRRGAALVGLAMSIEQLGERDGWRCHLCRRRVDRALASPHPQSPTFDHLTPISAGGVDEPTNLALAHRRCNVSRGNRGPAQLLLVG